MFRFALIIGLLASLHTHAAATTQPITYREEVRSNPPMRLHIVQIDLTDPRISIHAARAGGVDPDGPGEWQTTLAPTSLAARRENFAVAINANFFNVKEKRQILGREIPYFNGNWAKLAGLAVTNGEVVNPVKWQGGVVVSKRGEVDVGVITLPIEEIREAIDGSARLLTDGKVDIFPKGSSESPAPHTGVGIDAARKTLTIIVVDGRRPDYSVGITMNTLAQEFVRLGCARAINLDGGGSSTLVMRDIGGATWSVKNRPSDGHGIWGDPSIERSVAFVLGVKFDNRQ